MTQKFTLEIWAPTPANKKSKIPSATTDHWEAFGSQEIRPASLSLNLKMLGKLWKWKLVNCWRECLCVLIVTATRKTRCVDLMEEPSAEDARELNCPLGSQHVVMAAVEAAVALDVVLGKKFSKISSEIVFMLLNLQGTWRSLLWMRKSRSFRTRLSSPWTSQVNFSVFMSFSRKNSQTREWGNKANVVATAIMSCGDQERETNKSSSSAFFIPNWSAPRPISNRSYQWMLKSPIAHTYTHASITCNASWDVVLILIVFLCTILTFCCLSFLIYFHLFSPTKKKPLPHPSYRRRRAHKREKA